MSDNVPFNTDVRFNRVVNMANADRVEYKDGSIQNTDIASSADIQRSKLKEETLQVFGIPLDQVKASDLTHLTTSAGGNFGITAGTHGSATPKLVGQSASGGSVTDTGRFLFVLPAEYVAAGDVSIRVRARMTAAVNTSATIDVEVFKADKDGGVDGSDLVSTAAQSINSTSWADLDFSLSTTGLSPGDMLDIELTTVADDTGGTTGANSEISFVAPLLDIRG